AGEHQRWDGGPLPRAHLPAHRQGHVPRPDPRRLLRRRAARAEAGLENTATTASRDEGSGLTGTTADGCSVLGEHLRPAHAIAPLPEEGPCIGWLGPVACDAGGRQRW